MGRRTPHQPTEGTRMLGEPRDAYVIKYQGRDGNSGGSMPDAEQAKARRRRRSKNARAARRRNR